MICLVPTWGNRSVTAPSAEIRNRYQKHLDEHKVEVGQSRGRGEQAVDFSGQMDLQGLYRVFSFQKTGCYILHKGK